MYCKFIGFTLVVAGIMIGFAYATYLPEDYIPFYVMLIISAVLVVFGLSLPYLVARIKR
jgi:small basic protein